MKAIRFEIEGFFNSYKIPVFKNYHKTYLTPPKPMILGMLCNITGKGEKEFYKEFQDSIDISVVVNDIKGIVKDLWTYKILDKKNYGKSVIRRERNFLPKYTIYLYIEDSKTYEEVKNGLQNPKKTPSLGQDDELINIKNVKSVSLEEEENDVIDSIFETKEGIDFKVNNVNLEKYIIYPTIHNVYTKFNYPYDNNTEKKRKRNKREVEESKYIVEFYNGNIKFKSGSLKLYKDIEKNLNLSFY